MSGNQQGNPQRRGTDHYTAFMPWTREWCDLQRRERELRRMKSEAETRTPEQPLGPVYLDTETSYAREEMLTEFYLESGELPMPAEIKPRPGSLAEATAVHQKRLEQQAKRAEQNRQYRERHREKLQAYNTEYKRNRRSA